MEDCKKCPCCGGCETHRQCDCGQWLPNPRGPMSGCFMAQQQNIGPMCGEKINQPCLKPKPPKTAS